MDTTPVRVPLALWLATLGFAALSLYAMPLNVPAPLGLLLPLAGWLAACYAACANHGLLPHGPLTGPVVAWGLLLSNLAVPATAVAWDQGSVTEALVGALLGATLGLPVCAGLLLARITAPLRAQRSRGAP